MEYMYIAALANDIFLSMKFDFDHLNTVYFSITPVPLSKLFISSDLIIYITPQWAL